MQMTPEQVQIVQQLAIMNLENEAKTTQRVIQAIPPDNPEYKPDPVSMSSLGLAKHLASSELAILRGAITGTFDFSAGVPDSAQTPSDVAAWYGTKLNELLPELKALPADQASRIVDFGGFMQMPAVLYVNMAVCHSIHHRGQLSAHLRAAGGKVPSIYGPSYEDEQVRKAASASN
ncbi:MAG TPA: DinB family protein [Candidatus Acidoferrum sp.]|jgi:uncharacterized damage-inducible protein DinB|nr:DinB family protein [Candidatus Acidoferrum sp.]